MEDSVESGEFSVEYILKVEEQIMADIHCPSASYMGFIVVFKISSMKFH